MTREDEWGAEFDRHFEEASEPPKRRFSLGQIVRAGIVPATILVCSFLGLVLLLK